MAPVGVRDLRGHVAVHAVIVDVFVAAEDPAARVDEECDGAAIALRPRHREHRLSMTDHAPERTQVGAAVPRFEQHQRRNPSRHERPDAIGAARRYVHHDLAAVVIAVRLPVRTLLALHGVGAAESPDARIGRVVVGEHALAFAINDEAASRRLAIPGRVRAPALVDHVAVTAVAERDVAEVANVCLAAGELERSR